MTRSSGNAQTSESIDTSSTIDLTEENDHDVGATSMEAFQEKLEEILSDAYGEDSFETELDPDKIMYYIYVWMEDATEALEKAREGDPDDA